MRMLRNASLNKRLTYIECRILPIRIKHEGPFGVGLMDERFIELFRLSLRLPGT